MKATRLISMIICTLLFFSVSGMAQGFLEGVLKAAGDAAIDEAVDGIKGKKSSKKSTSTKRVTGFKVVSPHPDVDVEFIKCQMVGTNAIIDLTLTNNNSNDGEICLAGGNYDNGHAEAFDDQGNSYSKSNFAVSLANKEQQTWVACSNFPSGITIKCRFTIENINKDATTFKKISVFGGCKALGFDEQPFILHNVPITRQE